MELGALPDARISVLRRPLFLKMGQIKMFIPLNNGGKTEFGFNSLPRLSSQVLTPWRTHLNQACDSIGKSLWRARRRNKTAIGHYVRAITHVRYGTRNAAGHGFTNGIGKTFSPGRRRATDIECIVQALNIRSLTQQDNVGAKFILLDCFR
jgi:hypothetical protein